MMMSQGAPGPIKYHPRSRALVNWSLLLGPMPKEWGNIMEAQLFNANNSDVNFLGLSLIVHFRFFWGFLFRPRKSYLASYEVEWGRNQVNVVYIQDFPKTNQPHDVYLSICIFVYNLKWPPFRRHFVF